MWQNRSIMKKLRELEYLESLKSELKWACREFNEGDLDPSMDDLKAVVKKISRSSSTVDFS